MRGLWVAVVELVRLVQEREQGELEGEPVLEEARAPRQVLQAEREQVRGLEVLEVLGARREVQTQGEHYLEMKVR